MLGHRSSTLLFYLALIFLTGGCRRVFTFVPVEGTITKGGQSLAGVQVVFYSDPDSSTEGPRALGITDANGHYRLRTDRGEDGAVLGKHRVCIVAPPPQREERRASRRSGKDLPLQPAEVMALEGVGTTSVPAMYGRINETPLRAEVRPGAVQTCDFDIP